MITAIEITSRTPFVGGAAFGATGAYERLDGVAIGELDPAHPANRGIVNIDKAPRNARGMVEYRSDICILRPADPERGNGRILYEVNNRGRIMLFANLCAGKPGNQPASAADLGNALPLRLGFTLVWSGWDPGAPRANGGLGLDAPIATDNGAPIVRRIREEFISGTRGGELRQFRLSYEAATRDDAALTVRRTQTASRQPVAFEFIDARTVRLARGALPEPGSIYELRYDATNPRVLGIGFAATRDIVSHLRNSATGRDLLGRQPTHALGFGISQAGRYLRDHIAQGFNRDEAGARVFDGVFTHVAGIGRVFCNTEFGQPARTRTWHEDHGFPEVEFPFATGALMRGDDSDPKVIETNTSTEYWQKGASLLHTDPDGSARHGAAGERARLLPAGHAAWRQGRHAARCRSVQQSAQLARSDAGDPRAAGGARRVGGEGTRTAAVTPAAHRGRHAGARRGGGMAEARAVGAAARGERRGGDSATGPIRGRRRVHGRRWYRRSMRTATRSPAFGCPTSPCRVARSPGGICTGQPLPAGELADRDGTCLAFAATRAERERSGDPRPSLEERYPTQDAYAARACGMSVALAIAARSAAAR